MPISKPDERIPLADCPFCGSQPRNVYIRDGRQIMCLNRDCHATGPRAYNGKPDDLPAYDRAANAWNTRAQQAKPVVAEPTGAIPAPGQVTGKMVQDALDTFGHPPSFTAMKRALEAVFQAARMPAPVVEGRPMQTAPKDGTEILVRFREDDGVEGVALVYWQASEKSWVRPDSLQDEQGGYSEVWERQAICWLPVPNFTAPRATGETE